MESFHTIEWIYAPETFQERHQQCVDGRIIPMRRKRMVKGCAILYEKVFEGVFRHSDMRLFEFIVA
ncbi:hypothetical protein WUBG_01813, partial [Wuchereria bancrofti]